MPTPPPSLVPLLVNVGELYEALRESARRVFYLLTMEAVDGTLRVPEAERRGEGH